MDFSIGTFNLLSLQNPVFCSFIFWSSILVIKMLLMSAITGLNRFRYKVFTSSEDARAVPNSEVKYDEPHIERARRAHRNDLENILPYFTVGLFYVVTNPNPTVAVNVFRVASISRILHTLVYAFYPVPQPSRILTWLIHYIITICLALHVLFLTIKYI